MSFTQIHDVLNATEQELVALNVFDSFFEIDSELYIDPSLLTKSNSPEMHDAYAHMDKYFTDLLKIILRIQNRNDIYWRSASRRLRFPELPVSLGYSKAGTEGTGIGKKLAEQILETAILISRAGIHDPEIFELVGLFQTNIGPDRISDMCVHICVDYFLQFTDRVMTETGSDHRDVEFKNTQYKLPLHPTTKKWMILVPRDVLRDLPGSLDWSDADYIAIENENVRDSINEIIGANWKEATRTTRKEELLKALLEYPEALHDLIKQYKNKDYESYDFDNDPQGELIWADVAKLLATEHPIDLKNIDGEGAEYCKNVVDTIIKHFKTLVEDNGVWEVLYDRTERTSQLTFFATADAFCRANDLDISPETNSGRGPIDFKFSKGYHARVLAEFKMSKNTRLVHGYEKQLAIYEAAEKTAHSFFVIIQVTAENKPMRDVIKMDRNNRRINNSCPELRIIDSRPKDSASKA